MAFGNLNLWVRTLWLAAVLGLVPATAFSQAVGQPAAGVAGLPVPESLRDLTPEQVLLYLANEKVVAAGIGFINGQIGDPMSYILSIWGEPLKKRQDGLLGNLEFFYQPDPNLAIVFSGKKTVKTISIKGTYAALFRTSRGVRLGMPAQVVAQLYAYEAVNVKNNRAEFEEQGIDFHFSGGRLFKVVVYTPD